MPSTDLTLTKEQWKYKIAQVWELGFHDGFDAATDLARKGKYKAKLEGSERILEQFEALNK